MRRPAAPPKLGIRVGRNGGAGSGWRAGPAALGNSPRRRLVPTPGAWQGRAAVAPPGNFGGGDAG